MEWEIRIALEMQINMATALNAIATSFAVADKTKPLAYASVAILSRITLWAYFVIAKKKITT